MNFSADKSRSSVFVLLFLTGLFSVWVNQELSYWEESNKKDFLLRYSQTFIEICRNCCPIY